MSDSQNVGALVDEVAGGGVGSVTAGRFPAISGRLIGKGEANMTAPVLRPRRPRTIQASLIALLQAGMACALLAIEPADAAPPHIAAGFERQ